MEDIEPIPMIIQELVDVQSVNNEFEPVGEDRATFTRITCKLKRHDKDGTLIDVYLLLPRGENACRNTYLFADAIREE